MKMSGSDSFLISGEIFRSHREVIAAIVQQQFEISQVPATAKRHFAFEWETLSAKRFPSKSSLQLIEHFRRKQHVSDVNERRGTTLRKKFRYLFFFVNVDVTAKTARNVQSRACYRT